MDELAKTEARNYLSAAGFFIFAAIGLFPIMELTNPALLGAENTSTIHLIVGFGLMLISTLLIVLRKRDMMAMLFMLLGITELFLGYANVNNFALFIITGFALLVLLVTLTAKDRQKWLIILLPLLMFVNGCIVTFSSDITASAIVMGAATVLSLYFALCCASERINLPGRKLLTADEQTDFKASGSALGYMLFALICGLFVAFYIFELTAMQYTPLLAWGLGNLGFPVATLNAIEQLASVILIFIAILLLAVGKMRFTPIMFLLLGLTSILSQYSSGMMFIGIGILLIVIGLYAILRKESRILPGLMVIVYGCTGFFSAMAGSLTIAPVVSIVLNAIPCLIAIYLAFAVYSQRKLPKF